MKCMLPDNNKMLEKFKDIICVLTLNFVLILIWAQMDWLQFS